MSWNVLESVWAVESGSSRALMQGLVWTHLGPLVRFTSEVKKLIGNAKNSPDKAGDMGLIPAWGRSPGRGNGNPLQYSCLGNPMDRGAWWATIHGVTKSQTRLKLLSTLACTACHCRPPWKQRWFQGETKTKEESGCSILSYKYPPNQHNIQQGCPNISLTPVTTES